MSCASPAATTSPPPGFAETLAPNLLTPPTGDRSPYPTAAGKKTCFIVTGRRLGG